MANILMINIPYAGHIYPTLGLVTELVQRGNTVGYINAPEWKDTIDKTGAEFIPYLNYPTNLEGILVDWRCQMAAYTTGLAVASKYDLIIYEMMFFLGKTLADQIQKPVIRMFTMFAYNDAVVHDLIFKSPRWFYFRFSFVREQYTKIIAKNILIQEKDMFYEISRNIPDLNIVFTVKDFQIYAENFDNRFNFIGSSIQYRKSNTCIIPFDVMNYPIVYISMGTVYKNKSIFIKCIKAFAYQKVNVIMSVGKSIKINKLGELPPNIFAYTTVPQLEVLEKASLFITHGGMNSINEAMSFGVPMMVIPIGADQPTNADRVQSLGLGIRLNATTLSAKKLRDNAFWLLRNKNIIKKLEMMKNVMEYAGGINKAVELVENYIAKSIRNL